MLFYLYWNYKRDRQQGRLNSTEVLNLQNSVFKKLVDNYQKNLWNLNQLNWTCTMKNLSSALVDPDEFIDMQYAYLAHIQNCYYIENNDIY